MEQETSAQIEALRKSLDTVTEQMTVADLRRLHAKFFGCVLAIEKGFERRVPEAWAAYEQEFYGGIQAEVLKARERTQ